MIRQGKNSDLGTVNPFTASEKTTELNKTAKAANEGRKVPTVLTSSSVGV